MLKLTSSAIKKTGFSETISDVKIGLEIHVQLTALTSKLFCGCPTDYRGMPPNSVCCPICLGLPGTLPVINKRAIELAMMVSLALNSKISRNSSFYRKNYFYIDLPKDFQISQYDKAGGVPIAIGGFVEFEMNHQNKVIRIRRLQLEEDPGRQLGFGRGGGDHDVAAVDVLDGVGGRVRQRSDTPLVRAADVLYVTGVVRNPRAGALREDGAA